MPDEVLALWNELSGAEMLRAVVDGRIPFWFREQYDLLGLRIRGAEPGRIEMDWEPTDAVRNAVGGVDGGYIAMVFDQLCCSAGASQADRCYPMLTLSLNIDYLKPVRLGRTYRAHGELVHPGQRRMVANGRLFDPDGTLAAQATATITPDRAVADLMQRQRAT
ncbi:PaaI family thioesterase [Nocardia transvalensis]|uniref:PaaI family thioesterase n=1 Tax=Nocardia transvalensis TaxID=37333 RepID=UPI0018931DA1|nr:PaaI family thioesterase [Nocardia transvalensis]MBF6330513.1 PaaI family thioesterase [Nocardia transvalensis]